jgi:hypothetical protein
MDELLQKTNKVFSEQKLLGNYDFSEEEYSFMLNKVGRLCYKLLYYGEEFEARYHKLIFITLVEITKRWKDSEKEDDDEENFRFWDYISKFLIGEDNINQKLYHAFTVLISQMGNRRMLPTVLTGKRYYSTLMMHSFAPKNSIFSFFDLCYNIFKKDLEFGFTSDDEWLCEVVAEQMKTVLGGGYREDKKVSIGSSAYSIKIGLRSFSLHEDLSLEFINFIKDTFYQINKLFNRERINASTRLDNYIIEWWENRIEFENVACNTNGKKVGTTVTKDNIVAKYIRDENLVYLYIPSVRLDNDSCNVWITVYVKEEQVISEEIRTIKGELVYKSKPIALELNKLLMYYDIINIKVEIRENNSVIFNSEKTKSSSLNREFILFDREKEVFSQLNIPANYFVYSKDIDALKSVPHELTTCGTNFYSIYPKVGESLTGITKQVLFVDKIKSACLGKNICLIGNLLNVEWHLDEISCVVYASSVKLIIPVNFNLKVLELRIDKKTYKLIEINFESIENDCYQFELISLGLIHEGYPTEISVFSYEKEKTILNETIIVFPNLDIQFNHPFYYGDIVRKLTVNNGIEDQELTWSNKDNEIVCPFNDGILLIKVIYLKWRINNNEWKNEPINRKLWYKEFLENGDLLEIDNPIEDKDITIFGKADGEPFEIARNKIGKYEIGRSIFSYEGKRDISVYFLCGKYCFELFTIATKNHFTANPLLYINGKVFWNVEETFVGDKNNEFFLVIKSNDNNLRTKITNINSEIKNLNEDICKVQVKIKDQNIFLKTESYQLIYEGELLIGSPEKFKFKNKIISLISANCFNFKSSEWIPINPKYFIRKLKLVQEYENTYYAGQLCMVNHDGGIIVVNTMKNEKGEYDNINPVRVEFRDNSTLWLVAGWEGGNDFIGNLFYNMRLKDLCNIQKQDNRFDEINLYKYKEEDV